MWAPGMGGVTRRPPLNLRDRKLSQNMALLDESQKVTQGVRRKTKNGAPLGGERRLTM
ncbi:hypothetical protein D187_000882 [Cystobacter fuscus DSM 2262]|uniref:Uncharacterized protein n=1 Tax=Cystobacter fuscus (strain ATCC 25194 / DSM 2262 / NBRC 100088 / M29) TaxID=1242864 RepID=S9QIM5_CYSF2|nr:hypothetical protein D187_000882 [Cystobacter fuscus DSM 2262]